ncbi:cytochrome c [bacterium]|nr:cytochrome c [bacterium]
MRKPKWWGWISPAIVVLVVLSFIPLAMIYVARNSQSPIPRLSIIPDMDNQPRYKAQMESPLFADQRVMRRPVEGTVPAGSPVGNSLLTQGIVGDAWATAFPPEIELNDELLARGQERFNIYCAVCHGYDGSGSGAIDVRVQRLLSNDPTEIQQTSWVTPSNYHTDTVRERPVGHIFNTITNGIRTMPPYEKQLSIEDRWAIVAYVRALQLSRTASIEDVPAEERNVLESMPWPQQEPPAEGLADPAPAEPAVEDQDAPPAESTADAAEQPVAETGGEGGA